MNCIKDGAAGQGLFLSGKSWKQRWAGVQGPPSPRAGVQEPPSLRVGVQEPPSLRAGVQEPPSLCRCPISSLCRHKAGTWSWRENSVVKRPQCSSRRPMFSSQHPQPPGTPVLRDLMPPSGLFKHCTYVVYMHTCKQILIFIKINQNFDKNWGSRREDDHAHLWLGHWHGP